MCEADGQGRASCSEAAGANKVNAACGLILYSSYPSAGCDFACGVEKGVEQSWMGFLTSPLVEMTP